MRARERERFLRMNYNEGELKIRDRLYKARKNAKYKIRITEEHYDKKRKYSNDNPPYTNYLAYFSDFPEEGTYIDTICFSSPDDFRNIILLYEGLFYELFDIKTGERIGFGSLDPDSPVEEIRMHEGKMCDGDCGWHKRVLDGLNERVVQFQFDALIDDNKFTEDDEKAIREFLEERGLKILGFERTTSWTPQEYGI